MAKRGEQSVEIDAPPERCFEVLVDYDRLGEWQSAVRSCAVLTRDGEGRGRRVEFEVDAKVRTVHYVLEYSYEPPHRITWKYVEGDMRDVAGEYVLEDAGDGRTRATYRVELDPGVWMPGPLARTLRDQVMRRAVDELRRRVESG